MAAVQAALLAAFNTPGLWILVAGVAVAGLVRGFSGFGTAMVYLPVAAQILSPFEALTTLIVMDLIGPWPNVPRALRDGDPKDVLRLGVGAVLALPLGVWALSLIPPEVFRYGVSLVALTLLVVLLLGLRYHGRLSGPLMLLTGAGSGFLAGSVVLPGPPVILLYMAGPHRPQVIRANTILFLLLSDVLMLTVLYLNGFVVGSAVVLGVVLALPYMLANIAGAAIFRPEAARSYRGVAYLIIAASALHGLPFFD